MSKNIIKIIGDKIYRKIAPTVNGKAGEFWSKRDLKKLPKDEYLIINNLMIETQNVTHQIDHIIVSNYGIFIIETKHYNGYIVGNEYDNNWKINNKYYVNNPIHQNYGHVKAIKDILNVSEDKIIPIVCLTANCKTKLNVKSHVISIVDLLSIISSYKDIIINNKEEIYNKLLELNIKDKKVRKKHIDNAKIIKNNRDANTQSICPKCGGQLVLRNSKYGEFIGCSNYPNCKFIKK